MFLLVYHKLPHPAPLLLYQWVAETVRVKCLAQEPNEIIMPTPPFLPSNCVMMEYHEANSASGQ